MIILTTNRNFALVNYYCPHNVHLIIQNINVKSENCIIFGHFNSHSHSRGYNHIANREVIEKWQDENHLTLINRPNDAPTFYSTVHYVQERLDISL